MKDGPERFGESGIAIKHEILYSIEESAVGHGEVSGNLPHPRLVGIGREAGNVDLAAGDVDEEQDVVSHRTGERPNVLVQEVAAGQHVLVRGNEFGPTPALLAVRGRRPEVFLEDVAHG